MKLLVTVAHPDDEAFGCGSVLAHASARGLTTVVACATRGELGELAPGSGIDAGSLGSIREAELRAACGLLGVERVEVFNWIDSEMDGTPAPGSLAAADPEEVIASIVELIDDVRPDVVVTLDASDGHRDHAVIRDATLAAIERAATRPPRTYLHCLPGSLMAEFTRHPGLGTPDRDITTRVDVAAHLELRWRAMRAHRSQVPPYDAMSRELQDAFLTVDCLRRVDPPWRDEPVELDWIPNPAAPSTGTPTQASG